MARPGRTIVGSQLRLVVPAVGDQERGHDGIVVGVVLVLGVAALAGWWFLLSDEAPPEADIDTAGETLDEASTPGTGDASSGEAAAVDGTWTVDQTVGSFANFSGTWAGYRFDEELAGIGGNTAVGRTPDVTGTMTVADGAVTAVDVEVDLTTIDSDSDRRDGALRSRGLESDRFPTATFRLTEPVTLPTGLTDGERATVTATGELTIHGVTNEATVELQAELQDDVAVVVGSAPIALADHGIDPPTGLSVLSISDDGTFEFQLFFSKGQARRAQVASSDDSDTGMPSVSAYARLRSSHP